MQLFFTSYFLPFWQSLCIQRPKFSQLAQGLLAICACMLVAYALLFTVNATLDLQKYKDNVLKAYDKGYFATNYPEATIIIKPSRVDMWTECGGIGMAMHQYESIDDLFLTKRYGNCEALSVAAAQGFTQAPEVKYYRYIHGYSMVVRTVYTFFSMQSARTIITVISCTLLLLLGLALRAKVNAAVGAIVLGSFLLLNSPSMYVLATHATQFWLVLLASIMAIFLQNGSRFFILMACVGTLDAFFSILSMGSLSLSMPLLCFLLVKWKHLSAEASTEQVFSVLAQAFWGCVAWAVGFLVPWLFKWGIIIYVYNTAIAEIFGSTLDSYSASGVGMILLALSKNLLATHLGVWIPLFALLWWIRQKEKRVLPKGLWIVLFPALIPVIWCCLLPGQSGVSHSTFVNLIFWPIFCCINFYLFTPSKNARCKDLLPVHLRNL